MSGGYNPYRDSKGKFASGPGGTFKVGDHATVYSGKPGYLKELVEVTGFKEGKVQLSLLGGGKTKYTNKIPVMKEDKRGLYLGKPIY